MLLIGREREFINFIVVHRVATYLFKTFLDFPNLFQVFNSTHFYVFFILKSSLK